MHSAERSFDLLRQASHDHAWRQVSSPGDETGLLEGRYRCDLCGAEWAL